MDSINAKKLLNAAEKAANAIGVAMSIAITDSHGTLVAFHRMDGALPGSVDVAQRKAVTASLFPMSTRDFGALCRDQQLDGMLNTNGGLVGFAGGLPVPGGGAIGVSGGSADQDEQVALEALEA